jgi:sulfate permease, SulP family
VLSPLEPVPGAAQLKPNVRKTLDTSFFTFIVMWNARHITTKIPPLLVGLGLGAAFYFALVVAGLGVHLGPVIGVPIAVETPTPYKAMGDLPKFGEFAELLPLIVGGALALAFVAAMDALLCTKLVTPAGAAKV